MAKEEIAIKKKSINKMKVNLSPHFQIAIHNRKNRSQLHKDGPPHPLCANLKAPSWNSILNGFITAGIPVEFHLVHRTFWLSVNLFPSFHE